MDNDWQNEWLIRQKWAPCQRSFLILLTIFIFNINTAVVLAQLSPGELTKAHAHLNGLKKCSSCHTLGKREVGPKCLDCHQEIKAMRRSNTGLHGGADYGDCVTCHSEHHGADYELITWPDGESGFRHDVVGYEMSGAHLELDCRQCHNVKNVVDPGEMRKQHKNFDRTWLGLGQDCLACHQDPHAGELTAERTCVACHDTKTWQPALGFDHDLAAFPLTGLHADVACLDCHTSLETPVNVGSEKVAVARFKPQAHENCVSCHTDPHANALGPRCTDCHTTLGWLQISGDGFDHEKTQYPLEGRHASVTCAECHDQGRKKPEFAACQSCHQDSHNSASLQRPRLMACENCHEVAGFRPADFTMEQHAGLEFSLQGAHQATACLECHQPLAGKGVASVDLAPAHSSCTDCHVDPHLGETTALKIDCLSCHTEATWGQPTYDHGETDFALSGAHETTDCAACHQPNPRGETTFSQASSDCVSCHNDVHGGALVGGVDRQGKEVSCGSCHVTIDWFAEKFDHEIHSRFSLREGHEDVACEMCHLSRPDSGQTVAVFKPLPTDCLTCHGNTTPEASPNLKGKS